MLTLVALLLSQTPQHRLFQQPNLPREGLAFFEAFNGGAGTFGPCSTTAPTGAKGEVLTFTRASSATCTKTAAGGLATTGIANGDLVSLSSNVARVEYDSAGTLGLLVEAARTNMLLRSEEIDNASWTKFSTATVPTPNTVTAPDNALTADLVVVGGTPTSSTMVHQATTVVAASVYTCSGYVRPASGTGAVYFGLGNNVDFTTSWASTACSVTSASWTRCAVTRTATSTAHGFYVGSNPGGPNTIAANFDFALWGAQCELGAYATSYIPTAAAAVTRALETAKINAATFPVTAYSKAVTVTAEWSQAQAPGTWGLLIGEVGTTSGTDLFGVGSGVRTQNCSGACTAITSGALSIVAGTAVRLAADQSGGFANIYKNAVLVTGPSALTAPASPWSTTTGIGDNTADVGHLDGIISRICVDPDPLRCR